jgi:intein/homing endonuclease
LLEGTPECFEVTFEDNTSIICSDEHKFLIDGKWVEAKNLSIGMDATICD